MSFERCLRVLGRRLPWHHAALVLCLLFGQVGCTKASTFGCAAGIGAGLGLAALAAAQTNDPNLDAGAVVLGGGLFGITSGCLAAVVADAVARGETKSKAWRRERDRDPPAPHDTSRVAAVPTATAESDVVVADANLDGVKVTWQGAPRASAQRVRMRFQRYSTSNELLGCQELELATGDRSVRVALFHDMTTGGPSAQPQVAYAELDLAVIKALLTTKDTELVLCGLTRKLTEAAVQEVARFVGRFEALLPATSAPAPVPADCQPASEGAVQEGCP